MIRVGNGFDVHPPGDVDGDPFVSLAGLDVTDHAELVGLDGRTGGLAAVHRVERALVARRPRRTGRP